MLSPELSEPITGGSRLSCRPEGRVGEMADSLTAESYCQLRLTSSGLWIFVQVGAESHQDRISTRFSDTFGDSTLETIGLPVVLHRKHSIDES